MSLAVRNYTKLFEGKASPRISNLISMIFPSVPEIEADRACLITESYMETEGQPPVTRRARAFEKIMGKMPVVIRPGELIVGNLAVAPRGVQVFPEYSCAWVENEFDRFEKRPGDPYKISETTKQRLREAFKYWKNKTHSDLADAKLAAHPEVFPPMEADVFTVANYRYAAMGHVSVDYASVLRRGFKGIISDAIKSILGLNPKDADAAARKAFLEGVVICAKSMIAYANRCADAALALAEEQSDPARRNELLHIAAVCRNVPENPAVDFHEALQAFWFTHMALYVESNGHSMSPGRFDQYMYPFYKHSVIDGDMPRDTADELLDSLWVKFNEVCKVRDEGFAKGFGGYPMFQNLNVGGQAETGGDATNELSYACLNATIRTRLPQPSLSIRVWRGSPEALLHKGAELARTGVGMPSWFNDDVVMECMKRRGVSPEDARNYCILGCVEQNVGGKTLGMHGAAFFNLVRVLEITLNNGMSNGVRVGLDTGDPAGFTSIEDLLKAYERQIAHFVRLMALADNALDYAHGERNPLPYQSSLIRNCIAVGKSAQEGGAVYNMTGAQGVGVANVADAMMAVKRLVFEQKALSMEKLLALLESNYGAGFNENTFGSFTGAKRAGAASLSAAAAQITAEEGEYYRQMLLNRAPKYGNDLGEVDELARFVALVYCREVEKHVNARGGTFMAGLYPVSANVPMGKICGATPDGRHAGEPLADGISPAAGRDKLGPTAVLNSVARLEHAFAGNGALLNQKFHPAALEGEQGLANLSALVRAYFVGKGSHVQFNAVSRETLLEARKHPDKYGNLVIRVAGYSAHFVNLSPAIQEDIIARTDHVF